MKIKTIKIKFICDYCSFASENKEDFEEIGNFDLCLSCFEKYKIYLKNKGQDIIDFILNFKEN